MEVRLSIEDEKELSVTDSLIDEEFDIGKIDFGKKAPLVTVGDVISIEDRNFEILRIGVGKSKQGIQILLQVKEKK